MLVCLAAVCTAGCRDGGTETRSDSRLVPSSAESKTVFGTGSFEFTIAPPLQNGEQTLCRIDNGPAEPCSTDAETGVIEFRNLSPGLHSLTIELRAENGTLDTRNISYLEVLQPGVVVFGANPGGITVAIAAARAGQTVALIEPTDWIGGMMTAGLAKTDTGQRGPEIIGGLADEFFDRVRDAELAKGVCFGPCSERYDFEPHVAENVFEEMLEESRVIVERSTQLIDALREGNVITGIVTSRGTVSGSVFIDASYEGDLMALAGISWRLGREARMEPDPPDDPTQLATYEEHAGTGRYRVPLGSFVDPFLNPGDPSSGTLPYVEPRPADIPASGSADSRVMAFNFRLCVTDDPSNRIPFSRPPDYDVANYEAHARLAEAIAERRDLSDVMWNPSRTTLSRNRAYYKYDVNGGSTFSSDMTAPELNQSYVEAGEAQRTEIRSAYRSYIEGLHWTWQTDPRFGSLNEEVARFGYCADEFADRGGWPHKLYVRIARRMIGEYAMNENDVLQNGRRPTIADPVGFGAYGLDMHTHRYFAAPVNWPDGIRRDALVLEGYLIEHLPDNKPYPISWRALLPREADATNLINPVTLSATHVAYSSIRMEPTFMILGESAGIAAALVAESGEPVQVLSYERLRTRLIAAGQILDAPP